MFVVDGLIGQDPMGDVQADLGAGSLYNFCAVSELAAKAYRYKRCTVDVKLEPGAVYNFLPLGPIMCYN